MSKGDNETLLLELYKINDNYHNVKDNLVWISASAYLSASIAFVVWCSSLSTPMSLNQKVGFTITLVAAAFLSMIFVFLQNWYKARSVYITTRMNGLLRRDGKKRSLRRTEIVDSIDPIFFGSHELVAGSRMTLSYLRAKLLHESDGSQSDGFKALRIAIGELEKIAIDSRSAIGVSRAHLILTNGKAGLVLLVFMGFAVIYEMALVWLPN